MLCVSACVFVLTGEEEGGKSREAEKRDSPFCSFVFSVLSVCFVSTLQHMTHMTHTHTNTTPYTHHTVHTPHDSTHSNNSTAHTPTGFASSTTHSPTGPRMHYQWAQKAGLYIEQDVLAAWMRSPEERARTVILDVRDDDHAGGHLAGSLHRPDSTFDAAATLSELMDCKAHRVVLHCMESARRGPRCAYRLYEEWVARDHDARTPLELHVLKGGADLWMRRFVGHATLVEGFDNDYWGWPGDGTNGPGGGLRRLAEPTPGGVNSVPSHSLYARPTDQVATDWSSAGCEVHGEDAKTHA